MLGTDLLLLDVETTGLDPRTAEIIQLSACVLSRRDLSEVDVFSMRVRPSHPISPQAQAIHGLSFEDLEDEPELQAVIGEFHRFAPQHAILCGHNVGFDIGFLKAAY
ncbi:MAG TPA: 3'-5' exonuclease, partial [Longimicrobiaceae bacterium]|nr:3'-5' exonuclease [Longimicrobiaceae bacterium]